MKPLVSIVLPVYNQEKFIAETIESILVQTYHNYELIIWDDGSTDSSSDIIHKYAAKDSRIVVFNEINSGRSLATNKIIEKANGELCAFIDADDIMLPDRIEVQVNYHLAHPEIDATSCHCYYIDAKSTVMGKQLYPHLKTIQDCEKAIEENQIVLCPFTGIMIYRHVFLNIGGLDPNFWPSDDVEFVNRLLEKKHYLIIIQKILMKYRIHKSSITNSNSWRKNSDIIEYTYTSIQNRRNKIPMISFEDFKTSKNHDTFLEKLKRKTHYYSMYYNRKAGFSLYKKNYIIFLYYISIATIFDYNYVLSNIKNRLKINKVI